jgi:hypothetical protein
MKKLSTILILSLALYNSLLSQAVTDKQTTLVTKITADWCPKCGTWGWEYTTKLKAAAAGKDAILWNVHHSGGLETPTSNDLANNFGGFGQPIIYLNTDADDINLTSSNVTAKVDETIEAVDLLSSLGALVGMGGEAVLLGDKLTVNSKIKFYVDAQEGQYYVGMYVVQKNKVAFQQSVGANAVHHSVLTHSILPTSFGTKIATAPIDAEEEFTLTGHLDNLVLHNGKLEDTKIVVILWNFFDNKYNFVNARELDLVLDNTSSTNEKDNHRLDFTATSQNGNIEVNFNKEVSDNVEFQLYNTTGQLLPIQYQKINEKNFRINSTNIIGNHFIFASDKGEKVTKQILVSR